MKLFSRVCSDFICLSEDVLYDCQRDGCSDPGFCFVIFFCVLIKKLYFCKLKLRGGSLLLLTQ